MFTGGIAGITVPGGDAVSPSLAVATPPGGAMFHYGGFHSHARRFPGGPDCQTRPCCRTPWRRSGVPVGLNRRQFCLGWEDVKRGREERRLPVDVVVAPGCAATHDSCRVGKQAPGQVGIDSKSRMVHSASSAEGMSSHGVVHFIHDFVQLRLFVALLVVK